MDQCDVTVKLTFDLQAAKRHRFIWFSRHLLSEFFHIMSFVFGEISVTFDLWPLDSERFVFQSQQMILRRKTKPCLNVFLFLVLFFNVVASQPLPVLVLVPVLVLSPPET